MKWALIAQMAGVTVCGAGFLALVFAGSPTEAGEWPKRGPLFWIAVCAGGALIAAAIYLTPDQP
jgi:hypothetical protein